MTSSNKQQILGSLVNYAPILLPQTPCAVYKVAEFLANKDRYPSVSKVTRQIVEIAAEIPNTLIVENEKSAGYFLIFYHVEALQVLAGQTKLAAIDSPRGKPIIHGDPSSPEGVALAYLADTSRSALQALKQDITDLTNAPTAMEQQSLDNLKRAFAEIPVIEICSSDSYNKCKRSKKKDCASKIHFEKVLAPHSDPTLGDCSYLDTCFKGKQCKYVHYQIRYPNVAPRPVAGISSSIPSQYINANLLEFDLSLLGNEYAALIIDPPWDIHTNPGSHGGCSDEDVLGLSVEKLQHEGIVFLWVTGRVLDLGRQCLAKWGYKHVEELIWLKTNQLGRTICTGRTGHWLNHTKEHVLVGVKGKLGDNRPRVLDSDVIVSHALGRSQKPEELYGIIDRLVGPNAKKLELFGRKSNVRPGWLTVGNEMGSTRITDPQLKAKLHRSK